MSLPSPLHDPVCSFLFRFHFSSRTLPHQWHVLPLAFLSSCLSCTRTHKRTYKLLENFNWGPGWYVNHKHTQDGIYAAWILIFFLTFLCLFFILHWVPSLVFLCDSFSCLSSMIRSISWVSTMALQFPPSSPTWLSPFYIRPLLLPGVIPWVASSPTLV